MALFASPIASQQATRRSVVSKAFLGKKATTNIPGSGKGKVVKNRSLDGSVAGQQFEIRLGKNTTIPVTLGFTKSNELFVGRVAMLGFAAAVLGEIITGKGALAQFNLETGVPITDIDGFVLAIVAFNFFAALLPAKGRLVLPEEEVKDTRKAGALQDPSISVLQPKKFFGFSGFGFTKDNELFVGRMAQLGFAAALIGESITGQGPLGQLGLETGIPLYEAEPLLIFSIIFTLFAAINEGRGQFVDEE